MVLREKDELVLEKINQEDEEQVDPKEGEDQGGELDPTELHLPLV
jgi:hypothetical protein